MKLCPDCRTSYPDDVEVCPDDGVQLIDGAEELPENPELRDVIEVSPDDATSMVDLEALEREFRERQAKKAEEEAAREAAESERLDREREAEEEEARRNDPEATSTTFRSRTALDESTGDGDPVNDVPVPKREKTKGVTRREKTIAKSSTPVPRRKKKGRGKLVAALLMFALVLAVGGAAGGWYFFGPGRGRLLTVVTVPKGASVFVDGKLLGNSPLQTRVRPGTHQIELSLEGYETFKEVFKVEQNGDDVRFNQPLKSLAPKEDKAAQAALLARVDELVRKARAFIEARKFEQALIAIKQIIKLAPDDPRGDSLLDALARARIARATATKVKIKPVKLTAAQKRQKARENYAAGERQYRLGQFDEAIVSFRAAITFDSRYSSPHRSIARVFDRRGDTKKTRYHLSRFLQLGGRDADRTVKRWLDEHPK